MARTWALQDAKARFSEVVRRANADGPQVVTYRGVEKAVVVSADEFRRLHPGRRSFVDVLLDGPTLDDRTVETINRRSRDRAPEGQALSFLLDTNVISEPRRRKPETTVVTWLREQDRRSAFRQCADAAARLRLAPKHVAGETPSPVEASRPGSRQSGQHMKTGSCPSLGRSPRHGGASARGGRYRSSMASWQRRHSFIASRWSHATRAISTD